MSLAFFSYFLLWYGFQGTYIVKLRSVNFHMQSGNIGKQCIKRKTISNYSNRNTLICPLSQDGEYSVKTAYRMLVSEFYNCLPNCSSAETSNKLWNKIWKVQVPNKIRHFKWCCQRVSRPSKTYSNGMSSRKINAITVGNTQKIAYIPYGYVTRLYQFGSQKLTSSISIRKSLDRLLNWLVQ